MLGRVSPIVASLGASKIHCTAKRTHKNYDNLLNKLLDRHEMFWKLNELNKVLDVVSPAELQLQMNCLDAELTDYMHSFEKKLQSGLNIVQI